MYTFSQWFVDDYGQLDQQNECHHSCPPNPFIVLNHDSTEPSSLPYLALQLVHHHSHDKHKPNRDEQIQFTQDPKGHYTWRSDQTSYWIQYGRFCSQTVGSSRLASPTFSMASWYNGHSEYQLVAGGYVSSKLYLHKDDRTSYLRHTIGKLFYVLFVCVNIFFLLIIL